MCFYGMPDCDDEMFRYDICVPFSPESYLSGVHRTLEPGEFLIYKRKFEIQKALIRAECLSISVQLTKSQQFY